MNVIFLVLITSMLLMFALIIDKDILSPAAVFCESFLISLLVLSININEWDVNLSLETVVILIIGFVVFLGTSLFCKRVFDKKSKNKEYKENKLITVNKICFNIMVIFSLIISVLYVKSFYNSVGGFSNLSELSRAINYYRISTSYDLGDASAIPTLITQLYKVLKVFAMVCIYIFINNYYYKKSNNIKKKFELKYIFPFIILTPLTLLTGNRMELATLIIAIVIIFNIMAHRYGYKLNISTFRKYFILLICAVCLLSFTKNITGRTSNSKGFEYVSIYFGAPVELFDLYMKAPKTKSDFFGKETFWSLNNFIRRIQGKSTYQIHLPAKETNGHLLGNVYTAYRNLYQDFGIIGLIFLVSLESFVFSKMYYKIKNRDKNGVISIYEIVYALMIHVLFFFSFSEQFYNSVLSINYVILIVLFLIVRYFLTKVKIGGRKL